MPTQSDQASEDRIRPWTIKGIGPEVRNAAIAAAERAKLPIGEWMSRAIRGQVQADRQESRVPVPVRAEAPDRTAELAELERLVALTSTLSGAGAPPPKTVSRGAYSLIRQRLAEMKGPTKALSGPTKEAPGQTEGASGQTEVPGPEASE